MDCNSFRLRNKKGRVSSRPFVNESKAKKPWSPKEVLHGFSLSHWEAQRWMNPSLEFAHHHQLFLMEIICPIFQHFFPKFQRFIAKIENFVNQKFLPRSILNDNPS
jgi:hypothetical protein